MRKGRRNRGRRERRGRKGRGRGKYGSRNREERVKEERKCVEGKKEIKEFVLNIKKLTNTIGVKVRKRMYCTVSKKRQTNRRWQRKMARKVRKEQKRSTKWRVGKYQKLRKTIFLSSNSKTLAFHKYI